MIQYNTISCVEGIINNFITNFITTVTLSPGLVHVSVNKTVVLNGDYLQFYVSCKQTETHKTVRCTKQSCVHVHVCG